MALYLVQHGKSLPKTEDPDKGLSPEGAIEVERIAQVAKGYRVHVSTIYHSGKKRAIQTAELLANALDPGGGVLPMEGLNPMDDAADFALKVAADGKDQMIVGHLPFLSRLAGFLITGNTDRSVFKFQNGGIVCLDYFPDEGDWMIKWALMPNIG